MRIAVDTRELQGQPTGVGRLLAEILTAWQTLPEAQAHEFIQLTPGGVDRGTLWEQLDLPGLVRRAQADVLFSPGYTGPLRPPVPMVIAIHDVSFAAHPEWFSWREGARRRTITRLAARAATRVITISEFSKREIVAHLGVEESKIRVVYPGVTSLGAGRPFTGRQNVLFVGSIFNRRHVPELIEGFARLARRHPGIRLEVVGDNRTSPHIALTSHDGVNVRSYVPEEELRRLYAGSAAFAFLSEYEGFGLTPLEALAAGIPVLLLDTPVAREICGDAALYVKRADPALIEQALESLLFNNAERERILGAASSLLPRYSWTECARRVLHILVEAANG
jgi:glycosyltransferase involved in cell wall biosynthesis